MDTLKQQAKAAIWRGCYRAVNASLQEAKRKFIFDAEKEGGCGWSNPA